MKGMIYSYNVEELLSVKEKKYSEALIFSHKFPHAINSPLAVHNERLFFGDIAGAAVAESVSNLTNLTYVSFYFSIRNYNNKYNGITQNTIFFFVLISTCSSTST